MLSLKISLGQNSTSFAIETKNILKKSAENGCPTLDTVVSGSPLLQNGKIVGAVTHVLVNDPTMGYGIYIGNMLDAAA